MNNCKNSEEAQKAFWAHTFDDIKELVDQIRWARKRETEAGNPNPPKQMIASADRARPTEAAFEQQMLQFLAKKLANIFEDQNGRSLEPGTEIFGNKRLLADWKPAMMEFANRKVAGSKDARSVLNELNEAQNGELFHRPQKHSDVIHEQGATHKFRTNHNPLTENELVCLREYIEACEYFCEHAQDYGDGPKLSFSTEMAWQISSSGF